MASYEFIELNGVIVADTSTTKAEVESEYKTVFGDDIDLSDEGPAGVLVNAETASRNGIAVNNANLANQINPNKAGGVFLDAIFSLTSPAITAGRIGATRSTFSQAVNLTGVPGTFIGQGSIALTSNNDQFESVSDVTLDGAGLGSVNFQSVQTGPITADIGELNTVGEGSPLGWETVSNSVAATLGRTQESDSVARLRRADTLALQGISVSEAITSAVRNIDGVKSLSYRENFTDTDQTIDGVFLLKNSIYVCVDGGLDSDIAAQLLKNKTCGSNWNGAVSVNSVDPFSGQTYPVKFDRPVEIQAWIRVTIAQTTISNPADVIDSAVLNYANGLVEGERGFIVSANVSPFEVASAVNIEEPEIFVKSVELSTDGINYSISEININIFEIARTSAAQISTVIL